MTRKKVLFTFSPNQWHNKRDYITVVFVLCLVATWSSSCSRSRLWWGCNGWYKHTCSRLWWGCCNGWYKHTCPRLWWCCNGWYKHTCSRLWGCCTGWYKHAGSAYSSYLRYNESSKWSRSDGEVTCRWWSCMECRYHIRGWRSVKTTW